MTGILPARKGLLLPVWLLGMHCKVVCTDSAPVHYLAGCMDTATMPDVLRQTIGDVERAVLGTGCVHKA